MTRSTLFFALFSISATLFGQQDWQGNVKKVYQVDVPAYQGMKPVYGLAQKSAKMPDVEMYSLTIKLTQLKAPTEFFRTSLEKQGFKQVKATSTATLERVVMANSARKLAAVVVASKQNAQTMLVGVTVLPEANLPKE